MAFERRSSPKWKPIGVPIGISGYWNFCLLECLPLVSLPFECLCSVCLLVELLRWNLQDEVCWKPVEKSHRALLHYLRHIVSCDSQPYNLQFRITWVTERAGSSRSRSLWTNFSIHSTPSLLTDVHQILSIIRMVIRFVEGGWRDWENPTLFQIESFLMKISVRNRIENFEA